MAVPSGALLPVITKVFDTNGEFLGDAEQLWIKYPLVGTLVQGTFPTRIEISMPTVAPDTLPFTLPVVQPPVAAGESGSGGSTRTILAFASTEAPSTITGAALVAGGALSEDASDFATFSIWDCNPDGTHNGAALYTGTTETGGTNATGDWAGGALVVDAGLGVDIAAGHTLAVEWYTDNGAGVDIPGGWWRIT